MYSNVDVVDTELGWYMECAACLIISYSEACLRQPPVGQLVPFGAREAGCFREVAALNSDPPRQVPLYFFNLYQ